MSAACEGVNVKQMNSRIEIHEKKKHFKALGKTFIIVLPP